MAAFGLTVMIGVPWVTFAWTVKLPANTDCVVTGPPSPATTSTASVIRPESSLTASRAAISLPSAFDEIRIAAGSIFAATCCSASAFGATRNCVSDGSDSAITLVAPY